MVTIADKFGSIITERAPGKWSAKDAFKSLRPEADHSEEEIAELERIHKEQEAEKTQPAVNNLT
jgi:hypothetical protein